MQQLAFSLYMIVLVPEGSTPVVMDTEAGPLRQIVRARERQLSCQATSNRGSCLRSHLFVSRKQPEHCRIQNRTSAAPLVAFMCSVQGHQRARLRGDFRVAPPKDTMTTEQKITAPSDALETDCVAGHVGFEPANPSASYLIGFA